MDVSLLSAFWEEEHKREESSRWDDVEDRISRTLAGFVVCDVILTVPHVLTKCMMLPFVLFFTQLSTVRVLLLKFANAELHYGHVPTAHA